MSIAIRSQKALEIELHLPLRRQVMLLDTKVGPLTTTPSYVAYKTLHFGFVVLPIVAGLDKFFHMLVNWDMYLAPRIASLAPMSSHGLMSLVGVIEIIAGLLVAVRPAVGSFVVAAWLWGIIVNLLLIPGYYDIALRDFGLSLGALALAQLARVSEPLSRSRSHERTGV
jgi:hypothetical protein